MCVPKVKRKLIEEKGWRYSKQLQKESDE